MISTIEPGTEVRFTENNIQLLDTIDSLYFLNEIVSKGDRGIYQGPHPGLPDWHIVKVGNHLAPVHLNHIEVV